MLSNLRGMLPLAEAVRKAGHEVAIGTAPELKADVEQHGFAHIAAGYAWRPAMVQDTQDLGGELGEKMTDDDVRYGLAFSYFTGSPAISAARDLVAAADQWRPDLIVRSWVEFGGYLAAETLGIPHLSLGISGGPAALFAPQRLALALAPHRAALGLAPDPSGGTLYRYRHVALMPPEYDRDVAAIPNTVHHRHDSPFQPGDRLPSQLVAAIDDGRPLVYVSFGTLAPLLIGEDQNRITSLLRSVLAALAELSCVAVVASLNKSHDMELFGRQPDHVHLVGDLAPPLLLERCDLFVTHGGFNSVRESLARAVPMVAVPLIAEQAYNASNCAARGLAVAVSPREATGQTILAACERVLGDPTYRERARAQRAAIESLPSLDALAADLEQVTRGWSAR
ncbi:glycosyltransferase [Micromonospora arborensis]|uniref:glycosyltransferase n=1 Tax=Micromonospora arborensis TaxID=2116518 RepID=UPI00341F4DEB